MSKNLPMHYILKSTLARIFLFLELTLQQESHDLHTWLVLFLSSFDNTLFSLAILNSACSAEELVAF